jgi:ArsR family transcriptional regulator
MEMATGLERVTEQFAALAAPPRIQIIRLLLAAFRLGGMTAGQIQGELGMPASTLTHHLAKLESAGLIESRKDRQWIWYSAKTDGLRQLLDFLFQECCTRSEVISPEELTMGRKP